MSTLLPRLLPRLHGLIAPPPQQRRRRYLVDRLRGVNQHLHQYLRLRVPASLFPGFATAGSEGPAEVDDLFAQLSWDGYRPPRLPLAVDLFAPPGHLALLRRLWCFYGRGGVRCHPIFREHLDFRQPERMPQLAEALEAALRRAEGRPVHPQQFTSR